MGLWLLPFSSGAVPQPKLSASIQCNIPVCCIHMPHHPPWLRLNIGCELYSLACFSPTPRFITASSEVHCARLQANSSIPIVRQNMDTPATLGAIFYNSIAQNQSYGVAGMSSRAPCLPVLHVDDLRHMPLSCSTRVASVVDALYHVSTSVP